MGAAETGWRGERRSCHYGRMDPAEAFADLVGTASGRADPYPLYEELRAAGPTVTVGAPAGSGPAVTVVTGYAEADRILREPRMLVHDPRYLDSVWPGWEHNSSLTAIGYSILQTNPPGHERVRRLVSGVFTPRRLGAMRKQVDRLASDLADGMARAAKDGPVDFMAAFAYLLPVNVICELLGVPESDREWFRPIAHDIAATVEPMNLDFDVANASTDELTAYFDRLIAARRAAPREDLISALVAAHDADHEQLSGVELMANLVLLLVAGFETTTNLLGNGLRLLLERPDALAALRANPERASAYVEEMLRFDSPVQVTSRWTPVELDVGELHVGPAEEVFVLIGAANRDPRRFERPAVFEPARPGAGSLSFGAGAHFCVGQALARMEAQIAFPLLLDRFPDIAAAGEPQRKDRITLRGYATMPVTLDPIG
jgi:cytochrome P450